MSWCIARQSSTARLSNISRQLSQQDDLKTAVRANKKRCWIGTGYSGTAAVGNHTNCLLRKIRRTFRRSLFVPLRHSQTCECERPFERSDVGRVQFLLKSNDLHVLYLGGLKHIIFNKFQNQTKTKSTQDGYAVCVCLLLCTTWRPCTARCLVCCREWQNKALIVKNMNCFAHLFLYTVT